MQNLYTLKILDYCRTTDILKTEIHYVTYKFTNHANRILYVQVFRCYNFIEWVKAILKSYINLICVNII